MKKLSIVMFLIITLVLSSVCLAASTTKVIGVATVKKGTILPIMMILPAGPAMGELSAFEDQEVYIATEIPAAPDGKRKHRGGYTLVSAGFVNNCEIHGREVLDDFGTILLPIEEIEAGNVSIKLF